MKLLHTSDLHIGMKLMNHDLHEDQAYIFKQIIGYVKDYQPDVFIIAGDIYDKAIPSVEAVTLFDTFIQDILSAQPNIQVMAISGNHDSAGRIDVYRHLLEKQNIHMIGLPPQDEREPLEHVEVQDTYGSVHFYLCPFVKPSMLHTQTYDQAMDDILKRQTIDTSSRNVLVSHQFYLPVDMEPEEIERADSEIVTVGNIDAISSCCLDSFDYVALGHIHKPMSVGRKEVRYSGTPMAYSVSEAGQEKSVTLVELKEKGDIEITPLLLHPLHQVRVLEGDVQSLVDQACEDYVTVILNKDERIPNADVQAYLRNAFPNLLEIRKPYLRKTLSFQTYKETKSPYQMCQDFLGPMDDDLRDVLQNVMNEVLEESE